MSDMFQLRRLVYAKYIYIQGIERIKEKTSISNAMALLNFHDAAELYLLVIADNIGFKPPESFLGYWDEAQKKGIVLPGKGDMTKLNKMRVSFKHFGIIPTSDDCRDVQVGLDNFIAQTSGAILNIDFHAVSLTDLIKYGDLKRHLKDAEKLIQGGDYEKSIFQSAIAFGLFMKMTEGDIWHSYVLKDQPFRGLGSLSLSKVGNEETYKVFQTVGRQLDQMTETINVLMLGINTFEYQKFRLLTPGITITQGGKVHSFGSPSSFRNEINLNEENARFCMDFVINSVMKFQENRFGLFNRNRRHVIKTRKANTKVYSFANGVLRESELIDENITFKNATLTYVMNTNKDFWRVIIAEKESFIDTNDVDWIGEMSDGDRA